MMPDKDGFLEPDEYDGYVIPDDDEDEDDVDMLIYTPVAMPMVTTLDFTSPLAAQSPIIRVSGKLTTTELDALHAYTESGFFTSHSDLQKLVSKLLAAYEGR